MKKGKKSSNRSFGIVFAVFFSILAFYQYFKYDFVNYYLLSLAILLLFLGLINSGILSPFNNIWVRFGELLGLIIAPIVMLFVYVVTIIPTGIIMRLLGKDLLNLKYNNKASSYWIKKDDQDTSSMKDQF